MISVPPWLIFTSMGGPQSIMILGEASRFARTFETTFRSLASIANWRKESAWHTKFLRCPTTTLP